MKVVALVSGGIDSAVLLYHLLVQGHEIRTMSFNYGQRHVKELGRARAISLGVGVPYRTVGLAGLFLKSALTSNYKKIPEGHYTEESMKVTVVPNRNMIMLSIAIGYAISLDFDTVAFGSHAGDHAIYPDCRPEFLEAMKRVASLCSFKPVQVLAPFISKTKADVVKEGRRLGVPFENTWSCYVGGEKHCGRCGTCVERKEAFQLAGVEDPTEYEG